MALPAGISTATVTVGVPVTFSGLPVRTNVTITPSAFLVHTATGHPLVNMIETATASDGVAVQFTLPHTDQAGFQDEAGNAYQNWYYTATIQYQTDKATKAPFTKVFQLATGQTTVDLDLLPGGNPAMPYSAPIAGVTSVNGQTGSVTTPTTTDADVAGFVQGAGPTATALSATYASYVSLAKNPDTLIAGAVTLDGSDRVTSAVVQWPDGTPGTLTITERHATGAVNAYSITYGSPVTKTFTQPTITRNSNGAATNVPQIVVS